MTNYALLNNIDHKNTRVITDRSAKLGDAAMSTMIFPFEFRNIQSCYPILFQKDGETGKIFPVALLGLDKNENLFLTDSGWDATYIPVNMLRQPFMVGFQNAQPIVSIDMNSPRVNEAEGEQVFRDDGSNSDYLENVTAMLNEIHKNFKHGEKLVEALLEHELLEALSLKAALADGTEHKLLGFYIINEEKLCELNGETLGKLSDIGFLQPIFMAVASVSRLTALIDRKNKLLVC